MKQLMRGRNAIEAVISHNKRDGQLGRNYLGGEHGDKLNVLLSAVGYNLRIILRTLKIFLALDFIRLSSADKTARNTTQAQRIFPRFLKSFFQE